MLRPMPPALTLLLWTSAMLITPCAFAEAADHSLPSVAVSVDGLRSFGTSGKAVYPFTEGDKTEATLFEHEGKGCLTHMWFGGNWPNYERQRIRVYVDGEETASIDMELFLGHGIGFKDDFGPWGTKRIGKTGQPSGIYNTYRIPFGKSVRVTAQLHPGDTKNKRFWYIIRGVENLTVQFSGVRLPDNARLKLYKLENYAAQTLEEFDMCNTKRPGMLYMVTVAAKAGRSHTYLESCVRAYIDGAAEPMLLSSGLEDYFLGTYFFNRGMYHNEVAGLTHMNKQDHSFSAYRFHEEDPIFFNKGLRLTLRCGEEIGNQRHNKRTQRWKAPPTTYTTYVWIYEW
ncbi:MAG: DUF2961 domain-containing protein [Phycisphaerae bacterium]|nr:DUF2961 domain-containing protein [Phycisphaerae bacterium]NIU55464.1 DUF2961 domain-containing protein [Phycisphaerae bacterium]NIW96197.1 DUF2961 domain-containing protein [Phycisphaerae bacterium]